MSKQSLILHADLSALPKQMFQDACLLARDRVLRAFAGAEARQRGKDRPSPNRIIGLGPKQHHLVEYVLQLCRDKRKLHFVSVHQIRSLLNEHISERLARDIADDIEEQLLTLAVEEMCSSAPPSCEIWYESSSWNVLVSTMETFYARPTRKSHKVDRRNFHGRPRGQAMRRDGGCVTSVGNKRYA